MEVKNKSKYEDFKTEHQWNNDGFVLKENANGILLWTNQFCGCQAVYFSPDEVRKATQKELLELATKSRAARKAQEQSRAEELRKLELDNAYSWGFECGKKESSYNKVRGALKLLGWKLIAVQTDGSFSWNTYVAPKTVEIGDRVRVSYGREFRNGTVIKIDKPSSLIYDGFPRGLKKIETVLRN